ncbi:uncharacterized protein K02A2.6-like [Macrosteles quadrilineatus]|uniref:uncharacterized protein K02A2.6-like n=1 Tax=Macrosteles quadrilineatus TaxID=74068 RepID=UPI0023E16602|nr:uncharacterized protein K02A2.6-like [Macrosteles quadrilineatus]
MEVITPVDHATPWCSPMVVVPKKDSGNVRICVDLSKLNQSVRRQLHPIPGIEYTIAQIKGATVFSKLDANHGFWQIPLEEKSQDLTTFLTPWGRFKFKVLPFGITSAPEYFQKRIHAALGDQRNVKAYIDDILIWGSTQAEHDKVLVEVLEKLQKEGITLNKEKTVFSQPKIKFLGFELSADGISLDQERVKAISEMEPPTDVKGVQRYLGMINFSGRYIPNRSEILKPIHELLNKNNEWIWDKPQQKAFDTIKNLLTTAPHLAFYDPNLQTMISSDASSFGIGGVLLQREKSGTFKPVSYISRSLTDAERRYSNIEREALGIAWACDKLKDYIVGKDIIIETDHKPLLKILTSKNLDELTPRLQRIRLRMMRYSYNLVYTPGKHLITADCLSRNPLKDTENYDLEEELTYYVRQVISNVPTTDENIQKILHCQRQDPICMKLRNLIIDGWPEKSEIPDQLKTFFNVKEELSVADDLVLRGTRIYVPEALREEMLKRIHVGHLGITKCRLRASNSLWWPGISREIAKMVESCPQCIQHRKNKNEPLIPAEFPSRPWQIAAMDLFKLSGQWFIVLTDCYSRYFEIATLRSLTSHQVIEKCKSVFSRHGIPEEIRTDSGTQFTMRQGSEFQQFSKDYNFKLKTSSPHFHQSNGAAEAAVKVAKCILKKNKEDPYLALLSYRNTPISNGFSPAQLLMGRRLRDNLPVLPGLLTEKPDLSDLKQRERNYREKYKRNYDSRHGAKSLGSLKSGDSVWISDVGKPGTVVKTATEPRSYIVRTDTRDLRRNRFHLLPFPDDLKSTPSRDNVTEQNSTSVCTRSPKPQEDNSSYKTRHGRQVHPPRRLDL